MNKTFKFKCPKCGREILEEVITGIVLSTPLSKIAMTDDCPDPEYDYSKEESHDGIVDRYQCKNCGFVIPGATIIEEVIESEYVEVNKNG